MQDEPRPAFILDDVSRATLYDIQAQKMSGSSSILLNNVSDLNIYRMDNVKDSYSKTVGKKIL